MKKNNSLLKTKLENHYKDFDKSKISPDPLEFPHRFTDETNIELSAYLSSIFAYGNIKQIMHTLEKLQNLMNHNPIDFLHSFNSKKDKMQFSNLKHRFYSEDDIFHLFILLKDIYQNEGSLKNYFYSFYKKTETIKDSIHLFSQAVIEKSAKYNALSHGVKFMFPDPYKGSAAKRMNLFLRWMVRKDELDFGLWNEIPTSKLIIPVDTHIAKICSELKLTTKKNVSWKMAEEITENLKLFDANDPVKYDFSICHIGMRKLKF